MSGVRPSGRRHSTPHCQPGAATRPPAGAPLAHHRRWHRRGGRRRRHHRTRTVQQSWSARGRHRGDWHAELDHQHRAVAHSHRPGARRAARRHCSSHHSGQPAGRSVLVSQSRSLPGGGHGKAPTIVGSNTNWVAANGDDWHLDDEGGSPSCTYYPFVGTPNPNHTNTDYLRSLPTDPTALDTYLRAHVTGSGSTDEAVFVAIADTLHNYEGLVPPDTRAAFIEVLARVPSVTVRSNVSYGDGGTATTFSYKHEGTLWFDESTAQVVYQDGAPEYRIVDKLPDQVASRQTCPRGSD